MDEMPCVKQENTTPLKKMTVKIKRYLFFGLMSTLLVFEVNSYDGVITQTPKRTRPHDEQHKHLNTKAKTVLTFKINIIP